MTGTRAAGGDYIVNASCVYGNIVTAVFLKFLRKFKPDILRSACDNIIWDSN